MARVVIVAECKRGIRQRLSGQLNAAIFSLPSEEPVGPLACLTEWGGGGGGGGGGGAANTSTVANTRHGTDAITSTGSRDCGSAQAESGIRTAGLFPPLAIDLFLLSHVLSSDLQAGRRMDLAHSPFCPTDPSLLGSSSGYETDHEDRTRQGTGDRVPGKGRPRLLLPMIRLIQL